MWNPKRIGALIVGMALAATTLGPAACLALTDDSLSPSQLVDNYLTSLVIGDTGRLTECIAGTIARNNRQLVLSPDIYSDFLQSRNTGAKMTLEALFTEWEGMHARVRFDYPGSDREFRVLH